MANTSRNPVPKPVMILAVRWMRDEITTGDVQKQLKIAQVAQAVYRMGIAIRAACREGLIR